MMGGGLGAAARLAVSDFITARHGADFPLGTLAVNVSGCLLIGLLATVGGPDGRALIGPHGRQFFMIGVLGGYTTFSTFSLQTLRLTQGGQWLHAGWNIALSVGLCLAGVWLGQALARAVNHWLAR
jgi:CrcB protein